MGRPVDNRGSQSAADPGPRAGWAAVAQLAVGSGRTLRRRGVTHPLAPRAHIERDNTQRIARALQGRPSARLRQHRDEVLSVVAEYRASEPRVFGSVARGEDQAGSDLDLVVDFSADASLLDEIGLRLALTDLLGVAVDVVAGDTLRGELRERVLREAVPV